MRNPLVYIDLAHPVNVALEAVMNSLQDWIKIDNVRTADIVIVDRIAKLVGIYSSDQVFVIFGANREELFVTEAPANVHYVSVVNGVVELLLLGQSLKIDDEVRQPVAEIASIPENPDPEKTWVLVVDDKPENRQAAREQLVDFNVVVVGGYDEAIKAMAEFMFSYALIDLHLGLSTESVLGAAAIGEWLDKEIPYGMFLLIDACNAGIKSAIVTDLSHHDDPFSAAFDKYARQEICVGKSSGRFLHANMIGGVKDWKAALEQIQ